MDQEVAECEFQDLRLGKRFRKLLEQLSENVGGSIPWACQDWANTKAAYRFFSNDRVSEQQILAGHFQSIRERFFANGERALILHDTTEFIYHRTDVGSIGVRHKSPLGKYRDGRLLHYTVCGICVHSSLAVTTQGLLRGLAAIKFWTRDQFKGGNALKKKINPTRV